jgi:hypothetical protein
MKLWTYLLLACCIVHPSLCVGGRGWGDAEVSKWSEDESISFTEDNFCFQDSSYCEFWMQWHCIAHEGSCHNPLAPAPDPTQLGSASPRSFKALPTAPGTRHATRPTVRASQRWWMLLLTLNMKTNYNLRVSLSRINAPSNIDSPHVFETPGFGLHTRDIPPSASFHIFPVHSLLIILSFNSVQHKLLIMLLNNDP